MSPDIDTCDLPLHREARVGACGFFVVMASTSVPTPSSRGFTPHDSCTRLRRLQSVVGELSGTAAVDGVLFVGGVDGKNNLGSIHGLNYLFGGVHGYELLEKQSLAYAWLEDVVLWITPSSVDVHVGPEAYELVRQFAAVWAGNTNSSVTIRALPPKRVAAAQRDLEARVEAKRAVEVRRRMRRVEGIRDGSEEDEENEENDDDDERRTSDDSESDESSSDEDEDTAQDFKLESFVETFTGVKTVALSLVQAYDDSTDDDSKDNDSKDDDSFDETPKARPARNANASREMESWPLVQAYGLEGIGRGGFFTMSFSVFEIGEVLKRKCYNRLDRASLHWEIRNPVAQFTRHYNEAIDSLGEVSSAKRETFVEQHGSVTNKSPTTATQSEGFESVTNKSLTTESESIQSPEESWYAPLFDFFDYGSHRAAFGVKPVDTKKDAPEIRMATGHGTMIQRIMIQRMMIHLTKPRRRGPRETLTPAVKWNPGRWCRRTAWKVSAAAGSSP